MDRRYIDDHHVVARYLADRLTAEEREAFEAYYLEHPDIVQEMEAAARFKVGLAQLRDTGELGKLTQPQSRSALWRYFAVAAALAVLVIGAFLVIDRSPGAHTMVAASIDALPRIKGNAPEIVGRYAILRTRGSAVDAEIALPAAGEAIELRVLPEFTAEPARYTLRLFHMSADDSLQDVGELAGLVPEPDYFVTMFVDGSRLQPGQYRLAIVGDPDTDASDKESAFILRMRREPADPSAAPR